MSEVLCVEQGKVARSHGHWASGEMEAGLKLSTTDQPPGELDTALSKKLAIDAALEKGKSLCISITLDLDGQTLAQLPLGPGERERHMQIELACRYYGRGWLSFSQAARLAALDHYAFGVELGERGIPRQYGLTEAQEDIAHAGRQ